MRNIRYKSCTLVKNCQRGDSISRSTRFMLASNERRNKYDLSAAIFLVFLLNSRLKFGQMLTLWIWIFPALPGWCMYQSVRTLVPAKLCCWPGRSKLLNHTVTTTSYLNFPLSINVSKIEIHLLSLFELRYYFRFSLSELRYYSRHVQLSSSQVCRRRCSRSRRPANCLPHSGGMVAVDCIPRFLGYVSLCNGHVQAHCGAVHGPVSFDPRCRANLRRALL